MRLQVCPFRGPDGTRSWFDESASCLAIKRAHPHLSLWCGRLFVVWQPKENLELMDCSGWWEKSDEVDESTVSVGQNYNKNGHNNGQPLQSILCERMKKEERSVGTWLPGRHQLDRDLANEPPSLVSSSRWRNKQLLVDTCIATNYIRPILVS